MRKIIWITFLFLLTINIKSQSNQASLQETLDWLNSRLLTFEFPYSSEYKEYIFYWDAVKKVVKMDEFNDPSHTEKNTTVFDPKNINPKDIKIVKNYTYVDRTSYRIELYCNNSKECFTHPSSDGNWQSTYTIIFLHGVENDIPERIVNALKHLIKLRGGSGEKF